MNRYAYVLERLRDDDYRRLRAFRSEGAARFTTWLVVVVRRLCFDQHREAFGRLREATGIEHRQRRALSDFGLLEGDDVLATIPAAVDVEFEVALATRRAVLTAAVGRLAPHERLLLRLRFDEDLPAREIARILDLPTPFHAYRQINRVLATLRTWLAEAGVSDGSNP